MNAVSSALQSVSNAAGSMMGATRVVPPAQMGGRRRRHRKGTRKGTRKSRKNRKSTRRNRRN